jgi:hypothetical protein
MEMDMLNIIVRIKTVDMDGYTGRDYHPTKEMEGRFVRIYNVDTIPPPSHPFDHHGIGHVGLTMLLNERPDFDTRDREGYDAAFQIFSGILVDANGEDVEGGEVELIDHEIESVDDMPVLFSEFRA